MRALKFRIYEYLMNNPEYHTIKQLSNDLKIEPKRLDRLMKKLTKDYFNIKARQGVLSEEYYWEGE